MNAVFLDSLEPDIERVERVTDMLQSIERPPDSHLRPVRILLLQPSQDLAALASDQVMRFPRSLRFLLKGLGVSQKGGADLLSYLAFEQQYIERLVTLGHDDTRARFEEIREFFGRRGGRSVAGRVASTGIRAPRARPVLVKADRGHPRRRLRARPLDAPAGRRVAAASPVARGTADAGRAGADGGCTRHPDALDRADSRAGAGRRALPRRPEAARGLPALLLAGDYAQARAVLGELPRRPRTVLDLGSGPAPVAFAALDAGASEVTAADRSAPALTLARALAAEAEEPLATRAWTGGAALPRGSSTLITAWPRAERAGTWAAAISERGGAARAGAGAGPAGRIAGGAGARAARHLARAASPKGSAGAARVRGAGAMPVAGRCPALVKDSDWCHAERSWSPAAIAGRAGAGGGAAQGGAEDELPRARATGRGVGRAAGREVVPHRVGAARGEGPPAVHGCGPEGRIGLALQEKHRTPTNEVFFSLRRGDVVEVEGTEPRGDGLALVEGSSLRKVASAGQAFPPPAPEK